MTYYYSSYTNYEFTAFAESDLVSGNLGCGDKFEMPACSSVSITVNDNDKYLSGDSYCDENSDDRYGQKATIEDTDGNELGNGGQIYGEAFWWVKDQDGNWYVLVEIEQEGTSDDYFTFYTGSGYDVPPAGAQLTVHSSGNIKACGWNPEFTKLDAGECEPPTGSITGTVFCDTNCDGINGEVKVVPGCDYTIEAENMWDCGFNTFYSTTASGGKAVKLKCAGGYGELATNVGCESGKYDIKIRVQDECDGQSVIKLYVGGQYVDAVRLDDDNDGGGNDNGDFSTFVVKDVHIEKGETIKLKVYGDDGEYVRIDKIDFKGEDTTEIVSEPTKAGVAIKLLADVDGDGEYTDVVAETVTDADGNYRFDDVPVGDYKIMGTAPDGTEFTIQDVDGNSKDDIDSDVDANGMSGVVTVTAGGTADVDLGVCDTVPETGSITGTVFCDTDCDGLNEGNTIIPGKDYLIEAESMSKWQYSTASSSTASGGKIAKLNCNGTDGDLWTSFTGESGTYDICLFVQDENDGNSEIYVKVGGELVKIVKLDKNTDGSGNDNGPFSEFLIEGVEIEQGEEIKLWVGGDSGEFVRIDKVELKGEDKVINDGEPTKAGVAIKLLADVDGDGDYTDVVAETVTDADGNYRFDDVPVGDYKIMGTAPDGTEFTIQDVNGNANDDIDSDVDENGLSDVITVEAGGSGEVCVVDFNTGPNGEALAHGDVLQHGFKIDIMTVTTPSSSNPFVIQNLSDYAALQSAGSGSLDHYQPTQGNALNISKKADGSSAGELAGDTDFYLDFDFPVTMTSITTGDNEEGGVIRLYDENGAQIGSVNIPAIANGALQTIQIDVDGVARVEFDTGGSTFIDDITYTKPGNPTVVDLGVCEKEEEPGSLSGRYFCDTNDNDQDDGNGSEPAVAGVLVMLLDSAGNPAVDMDGNAVASVYTDSNGNYSFGNLAAGFYSVKFTDPDGVLDGKQLVSPNVGDDASDSDAIGDTTESVIENIEVVAGQDTPDNDAGVEYILGSLSGRYFCDTDDDNQDNNNGDEPAIEGVVVELLDAAGNGTGITTTTGPNGYYTFTGLLPGTYGVRFTDPDGVLDGKELITPNVGDDASDSDAIGDTTSAEITGITVVGGQDTPDNDAGVEYSNRDPEPMDDEGMGCYDEEICIDVLANDTDPDGDILSIASVNGIALGDTPMDLGDGVTAYINMDGKVCFDGTGNPDVAGLLTGEQLTLSYSYTVADGEGGVAMADVDVTFCGATDTMAKICETLDGVTVTVDLNGSQADVWNLTFTSSDARFNGFFEESYCLDRAAPLAPGVVSTFDATVSLLDEDCFDFTAFTSDTVAQNALDHAGEINWIINNRDTTLSAFTDAEVQSAIWSYTNNNPSINAFYDVGPDGTNDYADILALSDLEADYEVPIGGLVAAIINPDAATSVPAGTDQPFIVGLSLFEDCIC